MALLPAKKSPLGHHSHKLKYHGQCFLSDIAIHSWGYKSNQFEKKHTLVND